MSSIWKWLIPVGVVGGLVAVATMGHAAAGPAHLSAGKPMPDALKKSVDSALQSADPIVMRGLAAKVRQLGYAGQAASLEAAALAIEQAISGTPPAARAGTTRAALPAPGSERELAGRVALLYTGARAGSEGKEAQDTLRRFQTLETRRGFYKGNVDGLYGAKSARALASDHHIVPPVPLYWPRKEPEVTKRDYRALLQKLAQRDPQRAEEWNRAAAAVA